MNAADGGMRAAPEPTIDRRDRWAQPVTGLADRLSIAVGRHAAGECRFETETAVVSVLLTGQPNYEVRYAEGSRRMLRLQPGSGWILPAGLRGWAARDAPLTKVTARIPTVLLNETFRVDAHSFSPRVGSLDPLAAQLLIALQGPDAEPVPGHRDALALALLARVARDLMAGRHASAAAADARIQRAIDYIESHLGVRIPLSDIADAASMSVYHFIRAFKKATGQTPYRYLLERRLERAKALLGNSAMSIKEIAVNCGYPEPRHFSRRFSAAFGQTPQDFRRAG